MNSTKKKREAVKAPAEDDWNAHKELLRGLYFNSTLTKLMEQMERNFNFSASYVTTPCLNTKLLI
jgi:hypothetical protein